MAMGYKYQENYIRSFQDALKEPYQEKNRVIKAKKIVKIIEKFLNDNKLKVLETMRALDVGCSVGHITAYMASYVYEMIGTDIDEFAIEEAKKQHGSVANLQYLVADSMALPFEDNTFDLVICTQVYEHVPDSRQLMREIRRVLIQGGYATLLLHKDLFC